MIYHLKATITNGPSRMDLFMALAGCYPPKDSKNEPYLVEFAVDSAEESVTNSNGEIDNECISWRGEHLVARITGIQYESSLSESFNITGIITQRYLNSCFKKRVDSVSFTGYYNTKNREGSFKLALLKEDGQSPTEEW